MSMIMTCRGSSTSGQRFSTREQFADVRERTAMTDGEKMVWAAEFVRMCALMIERRPSPGDLDHAVACAGHAVDALRAAAARHPAGLAAEMTKS